MDKPSSDLPVFALIPNLRPIRLARAALNIVFFEIAY